MRGLCENELVLGTVYLLSVYRRIGSHISTLNFSLLSFVVDFFLSVKSELITKGSARVVGLSRVGNSVSVVDGGASFTLPL